MKSFGDAEEQLAGKATERTPLVASDSLTADGYLNVCSAGLYVWLCDLQKQVGHKLLVVLFFIEFLGRGLASACAAQATPYLFKEYNLPADQMQVYMGIIMLPFAMKPIIAFVSDVVPICGYHKAPYMIAASAVGAIAVLAVGILPQSYLPVSLLVAALILFQLELATDDILVEAKYAERIREMPSVGPSILSYVWGGMSFFGLVGVACAGPVIYYIGPKGLFLIAAIPAGAIVFPLALGYLEEHCVDAEALARTRKRFRAQWETCYLCMLMLVSCTALTALGLSTKGEAGINCVAGIVVGLFVLASFSTLLSPVIAMFTAWNMLQTSLSWSTASAGFYFMTDTPEQYPDGPHFSPVFYTSVLGGASGVLSIIGIISFQKYMSNWPYRNLLLITSVALTLLHLLDVVFYKRLNVKWGIPDHAFVLGTAVFGEILLQWQWMPQVIILSYLCPKGMEATMYALLAGTHNLGLTIANSCGAYMLQCWDIQPNGSVDESEQFANLWKASVVSAMLPLISIVALIKLVPDVKQGDQCMGDADDATTGSLWKRWT
jgi:folate/biopterin transporter